MVTQSEIINKNFKQLSEENKVNNAYLTGGLSTEKKMFEQVKEMKHSTFDLSKFEVVGTPTITENGIASGFSSSNYLIDNVVVKPKNKLEMIFKFTTSSDITTEQYIAGGIFGDTAERFALSIKSNGFQIPFGSSAINDISTWGLIGTPVANAVNFIKITWDGTIYNILHSLDENNWQTIRSINSTVAIDFSSLWIGLKYKTPNYFFKGSIDLKQFSITVDGVEVFNGNKTGIDQIKKDNYTVSGSPTITDDGRVSGFGDTSTNALIGNLPSISNQPFKIITKLNTGASNTARYIARLGNTSGTDSSFLINASNNLVMWYVVTDGTTRTDLTVKYPNIPANTDLWVKAENDGKKHWIAISYDGKTWIDGTEVKETSLPLTTQTANGIIIGRYFGATNVSSSHIIDLNTFKVYINDELVYQPTLRIPYTQSKTGSKIVDSNYRDRVQDLYEQTGKAKYYTVGENDCTLPMGEVYGMIESALSNKVDINSKVIDGQWNVLTEPVILSTSTAIGTYEIDLSNYILPDNYNYEAKLFVYLSRTDSSGTNTQIMIWNEYLGQTQSDGSFDTGEFFGRTDADGANFGQQSCVFSAIITPSRKLKMGIFSYKATTVYLKLIAFRRIGTNE